MYLIQWSFMDMVSICILNQSRCSPPKSYSIQSSIIYHKTYTCNVNITNMYYK